MFQTVTDSPSPYGIIFVISFCCWLGFEAWVFSRDRKSGRKRSRGNELGTLLAIALSITLALNMPALAPAFNMPEEPPVSPILGVMLIWCGILLRFWAIQTLGRFFSTKLTVQEGHELITTGPYKHLRNPSYTAALITFVGFGLCMSNWLSVAVLLLAGLTAYVTRIRLEERMLREQFGSSFEDYRKRTWALIPFIW